MPDSVHRIDLDAPPSASQISSYRDRAAEQDVSVEASFPTSDGNQKRLVVSPRGTVVLLNDVSEDTFNRSHSAEDIAAALPE